MNIAVVGASGIVGREFLKLICQRGLAYNKIYLFSSDRSAGKKIFINGKDHEFISLSKANIPDDVDIAFFSAGSSVSLKYVPLFAEKGTVVIDNSSAFRMKDNIPLVVPEINFNAIKEDDKIIANPNCSTIQFVLVLDLLKILRPKSIYISTYQSVSGAGLKALEDVLLDKSDFFEQGINRNVIPEIGEFNDLGETTEEEKIRKETVKILEIPLKINSFAVRVPTLFCHSESVIIEFESEVNIDDIKSLLEQSEVVVYDEKMNLSLDIAGSDKTFVSRLHQIKEYRDSINMWISADNIRTGAALNAVKIAERIINEKF